MLFRSVCTACGTYKGQPVRLADKAAAVAVEEKKTAKKTSKKAKAEEAKVEVEEVKAEETVEEKTEE